MQRILAMSLFFVLVFSVCLQAADQMNSADETERVILLVAQGFAFQNKEFKVVKLMISGEESGNSSDNLKSEQKNKNLKGTLEIGGFAFKVKPVVNGDDMLEADLMEPADPISSLEKGAEKKLEVPVGHISIKAQQPDPKNRVFLGDLRINSEKAEGIKGTFELFLNDHTQSLQKKRDNAENGGGRE